MSILKRLLYYATSSIFHLLLLTIPIFFAVTVVFGSPDHIKEALKESGVYDQYVEVVLDSSVDNASDEQTKKLLENQDIQNIAKQAFTPDLLEQSSNSFVQGIYDWLEGKTDEPQFTVDLTTAKTTLTQKLSDYAEQRASNLPVCTVEQLRTLDLTSDLLNLPCLPPGLSAEQVGDRFSQQLLANSNFLEQPIITNQTLREHNNGQPITENLQGVPSRYQQIQSFRWALLAVAIILGLLLILARHDRRAGLKHVARALVMSAVFLGVALLSYWYVFDKVATANSGGEVQTMVLSGATVLLTDINYIVGWFAASYAAVGVSTLLLLRYKWKEQETVIVNDPSATLPEIKNDIPSKK